jgi:hypothetical protein
VFSNTIVAEGVGIQLVGGSHTFRQRVLGNVVFAIRPIVAIDQMANVTGLPEQARFYLRHPTGRPGELDLSPLPGKLAKISLPQSISASFDDALVDFSGARRSATFAGAYDAASTSPFWLPQLAIKPRPNTPEQRIAACLER